MPHIGRGANMTPPRDEDDRAAIAFKMPAYWRLGVNIHGRHLPYFCFMSRRLLTLDYY